MQSTPVSVDIDFVCWGPFLTATGACTAGLTGANVVDCSYTLATVENCYIPNALVGEFYMFMLTNFSNQITNVQISQTSGTGAADCGNLISCNITDMNINLYCDSLTYDITGTIDYIFPPNTGS